jgi:hypothetical protein
MKRLALLSLGLVLALAVSAADAAAAAAPSSAPTVNGSAAGFCGVARGVAHDILNSTSLSGGSAATPANLKTTYTKIAAAEPALMSSAPTKLKSDLRRVFGFVNVLIADYKKVNWNARALLPDLPTLVPRARAVEGPMHTLKVYLNTRCKLNV